jgi:hypothetical protein
MKGCIGTGKGRKKEIRREGERTWAEKGTGERKGEEKRGLGQERNRKEGIEQRQ